MMPALTMICAPLAFSIRTRASFMASQRAFFDDRAVASLPAVQKRRGIECFLIDSLEELDDVQEVYSNLEISDEVMAIYDAET